MNGDGFRTSVHWVADQIVVNDAGVAITEHRKGKAALAGVVRCNTLDDVSIGRVGQVNFMVAATLPGGGL